jgi:superfamily II DNA or RNA helicase
LGGSDEDIQILIPELEREPIVSALFPLPDPEKPGNWDSAILLRDALKLKLRAGAGPFRSFGRIAVEPRAYQLVPLLMALKQKTIRLLIADDVGIGKTIEAALIVRELLDRGEIQRFAVLCPPHLVEQWQGELSERFHLQAVALTAQSVSRLESQVPSGISIFEYFPAVVMSLDYIKSERHRDHFLAGAPEMIVVDEAHSCTLSGQGRQLRYDLLRRLSENLDRHLVLLTATPHSGDDAAFHNLLSLLDPEFAALSDGLISADDPLRQRLAQHFVQRRRKDIEEWRDSAVFPRRMVTEITYSLSGAWGTFFDDVRKYCLGLATRAERESGQGARMIWYATLAILRCVGSSPAAAHHALTTRLSGTVEELAALADDERIEDGVGDELGSSDQEPAALLEDSAALSSLVERADKLRESGDDPKMLALIRHLEALFADTSKGDIYKPVVFCRYIATADYVATQLKKRFPEIVVDSVTGILSPDERSERVDALTEEHRAILVATDCLSEGVNLQDGFNAVVHYDLAWNPTRHEQREGRVDRFGQKSHEVRCAMLYGQDNPVDGLVLKVILRKAEAIREELGVLVPLPDNGERIGQALVKAALMKSHSRGQGSLDFGDSEATLEPLEPLETAWKDAIDKTRANRTIFAQRRLRPEEVMPEWNKQAKALGGDEDVETFVSTALIRLHAPLQKTGTKSYHFNPSQLPQVLKERLQAEGIEKPADIGFSYPPDKGSRFVHRSHALVSLLADELLEGALGGGKDDLPIARRAAVFESSTVDEVTSVYLIRARYQIEVTRGGKRNDLLAEEALALATVGRTKPVFLSEPEVERLLDEIPTGNLSPHVMTRELKDSIAWYEANATAFETIAREHSATLLADHRRVRDAAADRGQYAVSPCLPVDLIGLYVLLPEKV